MDDSDSGSDITVTSLATDGLTEFFGPDIVNNPNYASLLTDKEDQIYNSINSTKGM